MDYSIKGYLTRLSIEELENILNFCKEHNEDYKYIIEEILGIIDEKKNSKYNILVIGRTLSTQSRLC